jgi:phage FluMu protein Com
MEIVPINVTIKISSEDDRLIEYTVFVETDSIGLINIECPNCQHLFRTKFKVIQAFLKIRCPKCRDENHSRDYLLAYHSYVLDDLRDIAFNWMKNKIENMMEETFRDSKFIKFTRG